MRRFIFVMLDGVGVGALPDADLYGDSDSDTLGNVCRTLDLSLPTLERLGLGNIAPLPGIPPALEPEAMPGRLMPRSVGKDTTVGHWEHMGLVTARPFPTYPQGFPPEIIEEFSRRIGRGILGNKPASGTAIIDELGSTHLSTGKPIVYTSADSVFQIAAHVDIVPLETLYAWCQIAREILTQEHAVARVIARPFSGTPGRFVRTKERRDFSLPPPGPTYLDLLREAGVPVIAVGKISEIFCGRGVSTALKVASNTENLALVTQLVQGTCNRIRFAEGLLFTNMVDFDMLWGHRNDVEGFARGLEAIDHGLENILGALGPEDMLLVTADHGVDPTTPSTDHSREYVPVLLYPRVQGCPQTLYEGFFSDTGATAYEWLTGRTAVLEGQPLFRMSPARGWRKYPPVMSLPCRPHTVLPCRVGREDVLEAARWLRTKLGPAPEEALVLGSGLDLGDHGQLVVQVDFESVPRWRRPSVEGHPGRLSIVEKSGRRLVILFGRVHEYEGYDLSEIELPLRTLAEWGVRRAIVTSAAGAVRKGLRPGDVVLASHVLDLQHLGDDCAPALLAATSTRLLEHPRLSSTGVVMPPGTHAAVPGPQYETPAELAALEYLGASTVSMSLVGEAQAAADCGVEAVFLAVVTNVGDTQHQAVLAGARQVTDHLGNVIDRLLQLWLSASLETSAVSGEMG